MLEEGTQKSPSSLHYDTLWEMNQVQGVGVNDVTVYLRINKAAHHTPPSGPCSIASIRDFTHGKSYDNYNNHSNES